MKRRIVALALAWMLLGAAALGEGARVRVETVMDSGGAVGRYCVPEDWTVSSIVSVCGAGQSLGRPIQLSIDATDGRAMLSYCSGQDYLQIVEYSLNGASVKQQEDGQWDSDTLTPMLSLHSAAGYADYLIKRLYPDEQIVIAEEKAVDAARSNARAQELFDSTSAIFAADPSFTVDDAFADAAERTYTFTRDGTAYRATIAASVEAISVVQTAQLGFGDLRYAFISWTVPSVHALIAPEEDYARLRPAFDLFMLNTSASDSFNALALELSNQIREQVLANRSLSGAESACRGAISGLQDDPDGYRDERFTDYLLSQEDYALSTGAHVKIPNTLDYVYADDAGNVYATNLADDIPDGMHRIEKTK